MIIFSKLNPEMVAICTSMIAENDSAHREDHVIEVAHNVISLFNQLGLDPLSGVLAALIHDIYSGKFRTEHHEMSATWARLNLHRFGYGAYSEVVAQMCEGHRDSSDGAYINIFQEAFAAADRGPLTLKGSVLRALTKFDESAKHGPTPGLWNAIRTSLIHKFGKDGYACFNKIHSTFYRSAEGFAEEIERFELYKFEEIYKEYRPLEERIAALNLRSAELLPLVDWK